MALGATFAADFSQVERGARGASTQFKSMELSAVAAQRQINRIGDSFTGRKIITEANLATKAVEDIGGATRLTAKEQMALSATVDEALAKYKALGQQAPAELEKLQGELKDLRKAHDDTNQGASNAAGGLGTLTKAFGAYVSAQAVIGAVTNTLEYADSLGDMSARTGIGVESLQALTVAAEGNGSSLEKLTGSVNILQKRLAEGDKSAIGALDKMGISLGQFESMTADEQLFALSDSIGEVGSHNDQIALMNDLFGKGGSELLPAFAGGLRESAEAARQNGLVMDAELVQSLGDLNDELGEAKTAGLVLVGEVLRPFLPLLMATAEAVKGLSAEVHDLFNGNIDSANSFKRAIEANPIFRFTGWGELFGGDAKLPPVNTDSLKNVQKTVGEVRAALKAMAADRSLPDLGATGLALEEKLAAGATKTKDEAARAEQAYQDWKKQITGLGTAMAAAQLEQRFDRLNASGKLNAVATKAILVEYEKLRPKLKEYPPILEAIRRDYQDTLPSSRAFGVSFMQLATSVPGATRVIVDAAERVRVLTQATLPSTRAIKDLMVAAMAVPAPLKDMGDRAAEAAKEEREAAAAAREWKDGLSNLIGEVSHLGDIAPGKFGAVARSLSSIGDEVLHGIDLMDQYASATTATGKAMAGLSLGIAAVSAVISIGKWFDEKEVQRKVKAIQEDWRKLGFVISDTQALANMRAQNGWLTQFAESVRDAGGVTRQNLNEVGQAFLSIVQRAQEAGNRLKAGPTVGQAIARDGGDASLVMRQLAIEVDEIFPEMAKVITESGGLADASMLEIIRTLDALGVKSAAVAEFVSQQAQRAVGGLATFLKNATVTTQQSATAMGAALFGAFEAMTRGGMSALEAIKQIDPVLEQLDAQLQKAGLSGGAAFDQLRAMASIATGEVSGPLLEAVAGLNEALLGLHNSGILDQEMFAGLTAEVGNTFQKLKAAGVDGNQALRLMQPTLQTIWELQQDFGYAVDDTTQQMLDQAAATGLVGDKHRSVEEQMLAATERIALATEGLAALFGITLPDEAKAGATGIQSALDGIKPPSLTIDYRYRQKGPGLPGDNPPPGDNGGGDGTPPPGHAAGGVFTGEHVARIAEGGQPEIVGSVPFMRKALVGALTHLSRRAPGMASKEGMRQEVVFNLDGRELTRTVVRNMPGVLHVQGAT